MDPRMERRTAWIEELESGRWRQGKHNLVRHTEDGPVHCAVGVLHELARTRGWTVPGRYSDCADLTGLSRREVSQVVHYNDCGSTFEEIAEMVRGYPPPGRRG